jgi:hypothetical protein
VKHQKEGNLAAPRIRRVASSKESETVRDDFITQGYEVLREGEGTILLRRSTWGSISGHIIVAILTIWWTVGIGNLLYALVAHFTADQVLIKTDLPLAS